jgi:hypothetical protein
MVRWHGDDVVAAMPDKGCHGEDWMARILEPEVRWSAAAMPSSQLSWAFPLLTPGMEPRELRVEIASGMARVTHRNHDDIPTVSVDGPSFTTLFTGFRSALKLAREGALFGRPDAVQLCNRAFAGPLPWVAEHF